MSEENTLNWYNVLQSIVTIFTLVMTFFLAWYVNYSLKRKIYGQELTEKRLKELYRPMDIILRSSQMAFQRYLNADSEEQKFIAELWNEYNKSMKDLIIKNSYLFIEPEIPPVINQLLGHIDAYLFDYEKYKQGKASHPFPGERGHPFPREINDYFSNSSQMLARKLGAK